MKHTDPKTGKTINIPERDILEYIEKSRPFRIRVAKLLASAGGQKGGSKGGKTSAANMTPEARRARALKAVAAREKKRTDKRAKSVSDEN